MEPMTTSNRTSSVLQSPSESSMTEGIFTGTPKKFQINVKFDTGNNVSIFYNFCFKRIYFFTLYTDHVYNYTIPYIL